MKGIYLAINFLTLGLPLCVDLFYDLGLFKKLLRHPAILLIPGLVFLVGDYFLFALGTWSYNPSFSGFFYDSDFPLEEILFFFTTPYACLFIYRITPNIRVKDQKIFSFLSSLLRIVALLVIILGGYFSAVNPPFKIYTFFASISAGLSLFYLVHREWMIRFGLAYIFHLLPFFLINLVLTGLPVVIYNDTLNLSVRLGTIPIEDLLFSAALFLLTVAMYQQLEEKSR